VGLTLDSGIILCTEAHLVLSLNVALSELEIKS